MNRTQETGFRYAHAEKALRMLLKITSGEMGAFKARIRHLRKLGVPNLPASGSGRKISYSREDVFMIAVALRLQDLRMPPSVAVKGAHAALSKAERIRTGGSKFLLLMPGNKWNEVVVTVVDRITRTTELIEFVAHAALFVNIHSLWEGLENAL